MYDSYGKTFADAENLRKHNNGLQNIQKYHKCEICEKAFSSGGDLMKHINAVHNGQKNHKCEICGNTFSDVGDLKRHINGVHNGQKDHKCSLCGKGFNRAGYLKTHIDRVHSSLVSVTLKTVTRYFNFTIQNLVASYFITNFFSSNSLLLPLLYRYRDVWSCAWLNYNFGKVQLSKF